MSVGPDNCVRLHWFGQHHGTAGRQLEEAIVLGSFHARVRGNLVP